jgi:hypothetical protein
MADPETSSQAALVRGEEDGEGQEPSSESWRVRVAEKLESRRFQGLLFSLVSRLSWP